MVCTARFECHILFTRVRYVTNVPSLTRYMGTSGYGADYLTKNEPDGDTVYSPKSAWSRLVNYYNSAYVYRSD